MSLPSFPNAIPHRTNTAHVFVLREMLRVQSCLMNSEMTLAVSPHSLLDNMIAKSLFHQPPARDNQSLTMIISKTENIFCCQANFVCRPFMICIAIMYSLPKFKSCQSVIYKPLVDTLFGRVFPYLLPCA